MTERQEIKLITVVFILAVAALVALMIQAW